MDELNSLFDGLKQNSILKKHIQQLHIEHPLMPSLSYALQASWSTLCAQLDTTHNDNLALGGQWAQVALDLTWEQLNAGHWKDVDIVWKKSYSTAALLKMFCSATHGHIKEALEITDKGILLGAPILDHILQKVASILIKSISSINHHTNETDIKPSLVKNIDSATFEQNTGPPVEKKHKISFRNYKPIQPLSKTIQPLSKTIQPLSKTMCSSQSAERDPLSTDVSHIPLIDLARRVNVRYCPSLEEFMEEHMKSRVPVVISGGMDHWPAYAAKKWRCVCFIPGIVIATT